MTTSGMKFKITESVVVLDAVLMMDYLIRVKQSTEMVLHDKPVFQDFIMMSIWMFRSVNTYISSVFYLAPPPSRMMGNVFSYIKLMTLTTTKYVFTFLPTSILPKFFKTIIATKQTLSRPIVAISRACSFLSSRPSVLAGRSLIFGGAHITNIFHNLNNTPNSVRSQ